MPSTYRLKVKGLLPVERLFRLHIAQSQKDILFESYLFATLEPDPMGFAFARRLSLQA